MFDVSVPIKKDMVTWPNDPVFKSWPISHVDDGDEATVHQITMGTHAGTHLDAPIHFLSAASGVDRVLPRRVLGRVQVVDVGSAPLVTADVLDEKCSMLAASRILLKTLNSMRALLEQSTFHSDFVAIDASAAQWLLDHGIQTVGIDYYSIEPYETVGYPVHQLLLTAHVAIFEGVNLRRVPPGQYFMIAPPLRMEYLDGSPVRMFLLDESELQTLQS